MTVADLIETLIHLTCIGLLIHSIHDDPTGRADDGARMHAMCAWMLIVFNAMQIGITSTYLRDYGWLLSEPPTLLGVVNLVSTVIVLALVVRLTRDIRRKGRKDTMMDNTNETDPGPLERATTDLIVKDQAPALHREAERIKDTARPLIWVPDPANMSDHDAGNYRGQPIIPPAWAENTRPGWADAATIEPAGRKSAPRPRGTRILILIVAAVLILAAAIGGYAYAAVNIGRGVDSAATRAGGEDTSLTEALKDARELLESTDESQVADPATLDALSKAVKAAEGEQGVDVAEPNRLLVWELLDAENAYDTDATRAIDARNALDQAVKTVRSSIAEQAVSQAKATLQGKVDAAGKLLTDSDGRVQDDATRETLQQAIDAATTLLGDDSASVDDLDQAGKAIDDATAAVNDSVKAKQDADAQAQAAAAAQAQQAQPSYTPSYTPSYSGGGYTPSYTPTYTPSYGGGTSSGSNGSGSNDSGFSLDDFWAGSSTEGSCVPGQYCPIG